MPIRSNAKACDFPGRVEGPGVLKGVLHREAIKDLDFNRNTSSFEATFDLKEVLQHRLLFDISLSDARKRRKMTAWS